MADLGEIGVLALGTNYARATNANIPAVGALGDIHWEQVTNPGYTISGTVTDAFAAPMSAVVHLLSRSTGSNVVAAIEAIRVTDAVTGAYAFAVGDQNPRAILVFDNTSNYINSILIDKVVPG